MTISTPHITFLHLMSYGLPAAAIPHHVANFAFLGFFAVFPMIEFQYNRISFSTVYTGMILEIFKKILPVFFESSFLNFVISFCESLNVVSVVLSIIRTWSLKIRRLRWLSWVLKVA